MRPGSEQCARPTIGLMATWMLFAACATSHAEGAPADPVIARGELIARKQCWACHVVADTQEAPPILKTPTPSFSQIANRPSTSVEGLQKFLSTTHWDMKTVPVQMPEPLLNKEQLYAVSRYILSLRKP